MAIMQLPHFNAGVDITHKEKLYCEHWLGRWTRLEKGITNFSRKSLEQFVVYEVFTRQRSHVVTRLLSRLYKLKREWVTRDLINQVIPNTSQQPIVSLAVDWSDNEGERNREVLVQENQGVGRASDKADIVQ